jgi:hypothetical protein
MHIEHIDFLSDLADCNPENDNIDVNVVLTDGREFTFTIATPNNIFWCMDNENVNYFFGSPMIFVKRLTRESIEEVVSRIVTEDDGRWLEVYGSG